MTSHTPLPGRPATGNTTNEGETKMIQAKDYYDHALALHGHKCPAMPLGLRAGAAAMNALGVPAPPTASCWRRSRQARTTAGPASPTGCR